MQSRTGQKQRGQTGQYPHFPSVSPTLSHDTGPCDGSSESTASYALCFLLCLRTETYVWNPHNNL